MAKLVTLLSPVQLHSHWDAWLNHASENHLLAAREPGGTGLMYYFPLSAGAIKRFDRPNADFWCCSGTGIETPFLLPEWLARIDTTGADPEIEVVQGIPFTVQVAGKMLCLTEAAGGGHKLTASAGTRVVEGAALEQINATVRWEALSGDPTLGSFFYGSTLLAFTGLNAPVDAACHIPSMVDAIKGHLSSGQALSLPLIRVPDSTVDVRVMRITDIHSEPYTCIVRGFKSTELLDAWKDSAEADYAAQNLLQALTFDAIHCGSESSELTHDTAATPGSYAGELGPFTVRDIRTGQSYRTEVNLPRTGPCSIAITYWGGEFRRSFTVRNGDVDFLQRLELDKPNQPVTFCYPIPDDTPRDVPLVVSIDPEPGGYAGLVLAIRSIRFASPIHQPFKGETTMQTTPQLTPIRHTEITFRDAFWKPRIDRNRDVTLPHVLEKCEETGRFGNLRAAGRKNLGNPAPQTCEGYCFNDSDVYKAIEGAAYILAVKRDAKIERRVDAIIGLIAQAQEPDGYLYSPKTIGDPNNLPPGGTKRWESMDASHELYCVGHLYEAAVAHFRATGKRHLVRASAAISMAIRKSSSASPTFMEQPGMHATSALRSGSSHAAEMHPVKISLVSTLRTTSHWSSRRKPSGTPCALLIALARRSMSGTWRMTHRCVRWQTASGMMLLATKCTSRVGLAPAEVAKPSEIATSFRTERHTRKRVQVSRLPTGRTGWECATQTQNTPIFSSEPSTTRFSQALVSQVRTSST
jgi:hypothetical protein